MTQVKVVAIGCKN